MKKSLYKDERGLGHAVVIILVVAVVAAVGLIGWQVMQKNKTSPTLSTPAAKATNTACLKVYHDKILCNAEAANANFDKLAYTAIDTSVDAQGATSKFTMSSDGKGGSTVTMEGGGTAFSSVTIGTTNYVKNGTSWIKSTSTTPTITNPSSNIKSQFSKANTPAALLIQYKNLGKDKCGNVSCVKYQVIDPATPGTNYVWFSTKDYHLMRWYGKSTDGSTNDFVITYVAVKITTPSPVVDASAAAGAASGTPSAADLQAAQAAAAAAAAQSGQ